ncbi:hypothetical protein D3C80_927480 [compost metagenome]
MAVFVALAIFKHRIVRIAFILPVDAVDYVIPIIRMEEIEPRLSAFGKRILLGHATDPPPCRRIVFLSAFPIMVPDACRRPDERLVPTAFPDVEIRKPCLQSRYVDERGCDEIGRVQPCRCRSKMDESPSQRTVRLRQAQFHLTISGRLTAAKPGEKIRTVFDIDQICEKFHLEGAPVRLESLVRMVQSRLPIEQCYGKGNGVKEAGQRAGVSRR